MPIQHFLQAVLPKLQLHLLGLVFFNMEVIPLAKNISVWQTISCQNPVIPRHNIQLKLSVFPFASAEIKSQIVLSICHRNGPVLVVIPVLILPGQNSKVSFLAALFQHRNELYAIPVLNGTICRIQPGRNSKGSCNGNKQYFMGFLPCNLKIQRCTRSGVSRQTLLVVANRNIFLDPGPDPLRIRLEGIPLFLIEITQNLLSPFRKNLVLYSWIPHIRNIDLVRIKFPVNRSLLIVAFQHLRKSIPSVLLRQNCHHRLHLFHGVSIQAALPQRLEFGNFAAAVLAFLCNSSVIFLFLFFGNIPLGPACIFRGDHIEIHPQLVLIFLSQGADKFISISGVDHPLAVSALINCTDQQTSKACDKRNASVFISAYLRHWGKLPVIHNLGLHPCAASRGSFQIFYPDGDPLGLCIFAKKIDDPVHSVFSNDIFVRHGTVVPSGTDHHCSGCSVGKPALIQNCFRLTGSQVMPVAVAPDLHPGVVVVTVGPSWHIYWSRRDSCTSQHIYHKNRFLTAASHTASVDFQSRAGTHIRSLIHHFASAPVVDLQRSFHHAHALDPVLYFLPEISTAGFNFFIISSMKKHIVQKIKLRVFLHIRGIFPKPDSLLDIIQIGVECVISHIAVRHVAVQILHSNHNICI